MHAAVRALGVLALLTAGLPQVAAAQAYRCEVGGRTVFQQQPCADGRRVHGTGAPVPAAGAEPASATTGLRGGALCEAHARVAATDPEGLRVGTVSYLGARPWKVHQELIAARTYGLRLNARNANGGYDGERLFECLLSEDEARVLHFRAASAAR